MSRRPSTTNKPPIQNRYVSKREVPSMATPRRPEPPKKGGFLGLVFVLGILGGVSWLVMLIFQLGPYHADPAATPITNAFSTQTPFDVLVTATLPGSASTLGEPVPPISAATATNQPASTATATSTPELFPFVLDGEPEPMSSDLIRPQLGCDYLVIAGQVWDLQGDPVTDSAQVHLYGELSGYILDEYSLPGSAEVYGQSGYEFILKGLVVDSINTVIVQLEDLDGNPLSSPYFIETYQSCQQNLILVNFKKVR